MFIIIIFFGLFKSINLISYQIEFLNTNLCFCTKTDDPQCLSFTNFKVDDSKNTSANCDNAIRVYKTHANGTEKAHAFLYESGSLYATANHFEKKDCSRTKTFNLNEKKVILRFGQLIKLIDKTDIETTISSLLWEFDKLIYVLNAFGFYKEIKGSFDYVEMTKVMFI